MAEGMEERVKMGSFMGKDENESGEEVKWCGK